jgi:ATP phosphoribosyltransferase regulatory subunit
MTPQVARIDAHILNRPGVSRLCYLGSVLHAMPLHPMASRQPYVAGVELFGSESAESEAEVIRLGVEALHRFGIADVHLDFGHVGLLRSLLENEKEAVAEEDMKVIVEALSHKDVTTIQALKGRISDSIIEALITIAQVFGGFDALEELERYFSGNSRALEAIDRVRTLARLSGAEHVSFDFSDVHGYQYLTGVTFSVTIPKRFQAVLRGGRYDDIGAKYGRRRPAVGFTVYLREISSLLDSSRPYAVLAPNSLSDKALEEKVKELRGAGRIVVSALPEDSIASLEASFRLDEELVCENGEWSVKRRFAKN